MLAFERQGSGPPLVLIHGLGASMRIWDPVLERLAAERDVITLDLPGFGASDPLPPGTPVSPVNMAEEIRHLCEHLGIVRPHLAGNSLGGWTALEGGKAGWAASVTALSPAGMWGKRLGPRAYDVRPLARAMRPLITLMLRSRALRWVVLRSSFGHPGRVPAPEAKRTVLQWIDSKAYDDANTEMRKEIFDPAGFPPIPVTLAWGELDRLVGPPKKRQRPAGTRFIVLPDAGHTPTWDDPELVADVLLEGSAGGRDLESPIVPPEHGAARQLAGEQ